MNDIAKLRSVATLVSMAFSARQAVARLRAVRADDKDDKLELSDALLNVAVLVTGTLIVVRKLRSGDADEL